MMENELDVKELLEDQSIYKLLFDNCNSIMLIIDPSDGKIIKANPSACIFYGYNMDELLGKKITQINIMPPNEVFNEMNNAINRAKSQFAFKHRLANDEIRDVEVKSGPVIILGEKYLYSIIDDVTEKNRDITERKSTQQQLDEKIEFERLRTEFFANISHELRTPLNVILSSVQLLELYLQEELKDSDINKYRNIAAKMKSNGFRLSKIINNMIDMTKVGVEFYNLNLTNVDIVKVINDIVISTKDYVGKKGLTIEFQSNIDEEFIICDTGIIERVMLNLISNAIKFTEVGGKIEVSVQVKSKEVDISVKDTGVGISEEKLEYIFDKLVQVDKSLTRKNEGSGIGLSLVKLLVDMHSGRVRVKSGVGVGSEFTVTLPIRKIHGKFVNNEEINSNSFDIEKMNVEFSDIYLD